ncbi:ATP-dependent DNA ligase, partial [Blyttiomyces helicus]
AASTTDAPTTQPTEPSAPVASAALELENNPPSSPKRRRNEPSSPPRTKRARTETDDAAKKSEEKASPGTEAGVAMETAGAMHDEPKSRSGSETEMDAANSVPSNTQDLDQTVVSASPPTAKKLSSSPESSPVAAPDARRRRKTKIDSDSESGAEETVKVPAKVRARVKKDPAVVEDSDSAADKPAVPASPKKRVATSKAKKSVAEESDSAVEEPAEPSPKNARVRAKKASDEDSGSATEATVSKVKRATKAKAKSTSDEESASALKSTKRSTKAKKNKDAVDEESDDGTEVDSENAGRPSILFYPPKADEVASGSPKKPVKSSSPQKKAKETLSSDVLRSKAVAKKIKDPKKEKAKGGSASLMLAVAEEAKNKDRVKWEAGKSVPYAALCTTFEEIEVITSRLQISAILTDFFKTVIRLTPDDLIPCIYLCLNRICPEYEGKELGIGESLLIKAIANATACTPKAIKEKMAKEGDLGKVAQASRTKQKTIGTRDPLTVNKVFSTLKSIAELSGHQSQDKKIKSINSLLVACCGNEAKYLI